MWFPVWIYLSGQPEGLICYNMKAEMCRDPSVSTDPHIYALTSSGILFYKHFSWNRLIFHLIPWESAIEQKVLPPLWFYREHIYCSAATWVWDVERKSDLIFFLFSSYFICFVLRKRVLSWILVYSSTDAEAQNQVLSLKQLLDLDSFLFKRKA